MDNFELENDELMHYGVKGMKWGVRKDRGSSSSKGRTGRKKSSKNNAFNTMLKKRKKRKTQKAAAEAAERAKHKSVYEMSDEELRSAIKRMELERDYKKLVVQNNPNADRGKKFVTEVLEASGKGLAIQVANHYGAQALNKAIGEEVIFANNKKK